MHHPGVPYQIGVFCKLYRLHLRLAQQHHMPYSVAKKEVNCLLVRVLRFIRVKLLEFIKGLEICP